MASNSTKYVAAIVVIIIAAFSLYAAITFPRTAVSIPFSFTIGAENERRAFDVPWMHGLLQVEVSIQSGSTFWAARITSGNETIWSHTATQGGQTTYSSGWVEASSGRYAFTFGTVGLGSLQGEVKVTTKGGFW